MSTEADRVQPAESADWAPRKTVRKYFFCFEANNERTVVITHRSSGWNFCQLFFMFLIFLDSVFGLPGKQQLAKKVFTL